MYLAVGLSAVAVVLAYWYVTRPAPVPHIERVYPEQARPGWKGPLRDPSKPVVGASSIHCYDPATGYVLGEVPADTPDTIRAKIGRAVQAQEAWRTSSFEARRHVLRAMHAWIQRDLEPIARIACRDTGKTAIDAAFGELLTTCAKLAWTIQQGEKVLRPERRSGNLLLAHKRCTVFHEPLGVVAACVSWNYPVHNMLGPIISALFAGNAIVVKCSEQVAWTSHHMLTAVHRCLDACGAPRDLVQVVTCGPASVEALTRDPRLAHITFIGSDAVGRKVAEAAAPQLTATTLELGGKDPAVILPDTSLSFFTSMFMRACFQAMGQNCIGIERFIVPRSMVDELVDAVRPRIEKLRCGSFLDETRFGCGPDGQDTVDCGAMISDARFDALEALITDAVAHGAKLVLGGHRLVHPTWPLGHYFAPTLLTHVTPSMRIAQEELFAPVFLIMAYDDVEEAVQIANGTAFGLGSSVFGRTKAQCHAVAVRLQSGMVNINDFGISYLNQGLPFGGRKDSGYGRFAGPEGLLGLTAPKAVTEDVAFGLVQTSIPPVVDYPLSNTQRSWTFLRSLVRLAFGSWTDALGAIPGLL
ncbi:Meiotic Sister-Chromatid recombination aldehyde dehydrogenase [Malassezia pachydermatis]